MGINTAIYLLMINSTQGLFHSNTSMDKLELFLLYSYLLYTMIILLVLEKNFSIFYFIFTPCIFKATSILHINLNDPPIEDNAGDVYLEYSI